MKSCRVKCMRTKKISYSKSRMKNGEIIGNDDDANIIQNGIAAYSEAYEQECENAGFYK